MVSIVQIALETMQHVVDFRQSGLFQHQSRLHRAAPGAANQQHGAVDAGCGFYVGHEVRVHFPFRGVHPGNQDRAIGVADEEEFHFAAHVDEHRFAAGVEEFVGLLGGEVFHHGSPAVRG